ncbi:hypothetical protein [Jannaschia sp. CCS1]|uniref:hypothetical protein n=1 Tax=Jannaschia sp. (strain CCS1) TaxID=290400 RepID=UPI00140FE22C|nr:hypothetical protein [Jannaschia sp. CCS1]
MGFTLMCGLSLHAQTIPVQSGDHPNFTRLVLPIGADREWDLDQSSGDQWNLTITPAVDGFDTSRMFELIQRDRLLNVVATQALSLDLACTCDVTSFRYDTRFLVIDITDPDPNAPLPEVQVTDAEVEAAERTAAAEALPDLANLLRAPDDLPRIDPRAAPVIAETPIETPDPVAPNPRLAEAAQIMAEQLARAAAAGLLDIAVDESMTSADPSESTAPDPNSATEPTAVVDTDPTGTATPTLPIQPTVPPAEALPIRAETAFDAILPAGESIGETPLETSCLNVPFTVAEWTDGEDIYHSLGALRLALYDERDMLRPDAAIELAQHYIYYGFGSEAAYWLDQVDAAPVALRDIAALIDGNDTVQFLPVHSTEDCSEGELLWRYLGGAVQGPMTVDDTAAIQRAYDTLPPNLRDHMGPRLAVQLSEDGYSGTARNIRDILHRGGRIDADALRILDLDLGVPMELTPEQTRQELDRALRDSEDPADVLANALAFDRRNGILPTPSRLTTADALMREIGSGQATDDLWRETLLAHAALGQIDEALSRLGDPSRADATRAEALTDLISERVSVGDTASLVILAHIHGRNWRPEGSAAGRVQVRAIAALRQEGLFEAAQIFRDVRLPLILPAPDGPSEEPVDEAVSAWQDGDWQRLATAGTGAHSDVAERLATLGNDVQITPSVSGPPDLNSLTETLQDSRALRSTITQLLAQPALP